MNTANERFDDLFRGLLKETIDTQLNLYDVRMPEGVRVAYVNSVCYHLKKNIKDKDFHLHYDCRNFVPSCLDSVKQSFDITISEGASELISAEVDKSLSSPLKDYHEWIIDIKSRKEAIDSLDTPEKVAGWLLDKSLKDPAPELSFSQKDLLEKLGQYLYSNFENIRVEFRKHRNDRIIMEPITTFVYEGTGLPSDRILSTDRDYTLVLHDYVRDYLKLSCFWNEDQLVLT